MLALTITLLFLAQLGLMAGLYFGWSISVMPGLGRTAPPAGIEAMQRMNESILNPLFFACFLGAIPVGLAALLLTPSYLLAAALLLYAGSVVTTMLFNVPINNTIAACNPADPPLQWSDLHKRWTRWNHVRCAADTAALVLAALALRGA